MKCGYTTRVMWTTDGGGYVSIQEKVWHRLADMVNCVARKQLEHWRFLHACAMQTVNISHALAESISDKTGGRPGLETGQRNSDRLGTRTSLRPNKRNEKSMYSRAWSNQQL